MMKLKEPYMVYDDEKDVVHIYDGKVEVVRIEHPLINLDYLAQSLGCVIENNVAHNYGLRTYLVDVHVLSLPKKEIHYETLTNK